MNARMDDNPAAIRANEVWARFVGMFGGDAVERKFGPTPPLEWVAMISRLHKQEIDRGIRRLAYSGSKFVPTLPEFTRLCRTTGGDDIDEGPQRQPALPSPSEDYDAWEIRANDFLLGHITKKFEVDPGHYGLRDSDDFVANVRTLVQAKKRWAADMRAEAVDGHVPVDVQKAVWRQYFDGAEGEIEQRMGAEGA